METETREMQNLRPVDSPPADDASQRPQLPPVDGGKDAWLFLAACFIIEALVWGKSLFSRVDEYILLT
jgi:hypothetical protein